MKHCEYECVSVWECGCVGECAWQCVRQLDKFPQKARQVEIR